MLNPLEAADLEVAPAHAVTPFGRSRGIRRRTPPVGGPPGLVLRMFVLGAFAFDDEVRVSRP